MKVYVKWRRAYLLLLAPILLIGFLLLALPLPIGNSFQVKGRLSKADVQSIRRELRQVRGVEYRNSILHFRIGSFWNQIRLAGTCPLVSVESFDGTSATATFKGTSWAGNKVKMQYELSKRAESWSVTTVSGEETIGSP